MSPYPLTKIVRHLITAFPASIKAVNWLTKIFRNLFNTILEGITWPTKKNWYCKFLISMITIGNSLNSIHFCGDSPTPTHEEHDQPFCVYPLNHIYLPEDICVSIVNPGCCDVKKAGNGSFDIKKSMKFYSTLVLSELCPPEDI